MVHALGHNAALGVDGGLMEARRQPRLIGRDATDRHDRLHAFFQRREHQCQEATRPVACHSQAGEVHVVAQGEVVERADGIPDLIAGGAEPDEATLILGGGQFGAR